MINTKLLSTDELIAYRSELVKKKNAFRALWRNSKEFQDFRKKNGADVIDAEHNRISKIIASRDYRNK